VGIRLNERAIPRSHHEVFLANDLGSKESVGSVTSGGWSPSLQAGIAFARLRNEATKLGTSVTIEIRGKRYSGSVVKKKFVGD
jgi:aminomethyltransferase